MKKKEKKEKDKRAVRSNLKMDIPGDRGPRAEEDGLFKVSTIRTNKDLVNLLDINADEVAEDSDDEQEKKKKIKVQKFEREMGRLNDDGNWYEEHDDVIRDSSDAEDDDSDDEAEDLGLQPDSDEDDDVDETVNDEDPNKDNPVLTSLSPLSQESQEKRRERKAEQWFKKIGDLDDESDLEDAEMEKAVEKVHKSGGTLNKKQKDKPQEFDYASDGSDTDEDKTTTTNSKDEEQPEDLQKQKDESSSDESSSDEDDSEVDTDEEQSKPKVDAGGFEIVPQKPIPQPKIKKRKQMSAEQLAIGEQLIKSKKSKRDLMDAGWNRYMFDDVALPDWFALDQENHYTRKVEVDPETVKKYQDREKELNVKTIKKVVEAKARRKKRVQLKLAKAKKKASALLDNADIGSHEKAKEIKKMYKSAQVEARRKKDVKYIVSKKYNAGKKPSGTKGPFNRRF
jgi:AdoMet-dependent rRNA methyltransferase SPB1